jgi:hypothetical protein
LLRDAGQRNGSDVELALANQRQEQIEGTIEDVEGDPQQGRRDAGGRRSGRGRR